jgi:hypothetical protein
VTFESHTFDLASSGSKFAQSFAPEYLFTLLYLVAETCISPLLKPVLVATSVWLCEQFIHLTVLEMSIARCCFGAEACLHDLSHDAGMNISGYVWVAFF